MKRTLLVFLALALVGSFAFAEVTGVEAPTVSGDVTTTYGYNFDNGADGFNNSANVDVVVPFAGGSDTKSGEGDIWAEITIEDIDLNISDSSGVSSVGFDANGVATDESGAASISAKIHMGNLYLGLGNPTLDFNNVDLDADMQADGDVDSDSNVDVNANQNGSDGVSFGYVTDMFSVEIGVASKADAYAALDAGYGNVADDSTKSWIDTNTLYDNTGSGGATPNYINDYVFGGNASVVAGPATIPVYFAYDNNYAAATPLFVAMGAAPSVAMGDLTLDIPVDYVALGAEYGMEAYPALGYAIAGVGSVTADFLYAKYDIAVAPHALRMKTGLSFSQAFMDALTLDLAYDLTGFGGNKADMSWDVSLDAGYDLGMLAPYLGVDYGGNKDLDLSVGSTVAVIDMATLTIDYTNGHVLADGTVGDKAQAGTVTVSIGVTY